MLTAQPAAAVASRGYEVHCRAQRRNLAGRHVAALCTQHGLRRAERRGRRSDSAMTAATPMDISSVSSKTIHLLRHGETEMNVWLGINATGPGDYQDPLMYDTVLTANGQQQAAAAATCIPSLSPAPELIVCSPLTRALQTAELAFKGYDCERIMTHLAAERLYHASDVGRVKAELLPCWPAYDGAHLPTGFWWHTDNPADPTAVCPESDETFEERMNRLRNFLHSRPEQSIALVAHWGVFATLAGRSLQNAEFATINI